MTRTCTEGFYTPPPPTNSYYHTSTTASDPKLRTCQTDNFHIRRNNNLPTGDSPYVRAKHVQLVDKNPGKAVSLFWAAINSGDRVDSALKDMAVVMKQLDRSDEAIEAIKSFRSLCHPQSQDSLDNVLVELYKRSGRIEEEIELLNHKLKRIEEGATFGGQRSKIVRSQGRRVQVTVEQETARILGNMAWAYLQLGEYKIAEDKYREGLSLEPDKNMQCNLAYCLLQTSRIEEAKTLLDGVNFSSEDGYMDDSYAKSYERALSKLAELEQENSQMKVRGSLTATPCKSAYHQNQWNAGRTFQRRINFDSRKHENRCFNGATVENVHNGFPNSSPVILTQPRSPWRLTNPDTRKKLWNGRVVGNSSRKLSFEQPNIKSHQAASDYQILKRNDGDLDGGKGLDWRAKALEALQLGDIVIHHVVDENRSGIAVKDDEKSVITNGNPSLTRQNETESQKVSDHGYHAEADKNRKNNAEYQKPSAEPLMLSHFSKKSWADIVEEEELFAGMEILNRENLDPDFHFLAPGKMTQQTEDRANNLYNNMAGDFKNID